MDGARVSGAEMSSWRRGRGKRKFVDVGGVKGRWERLMPKMLSEYGTGAGNGFEVRGRSVASKLLRGRNEEPRMKDERKGACDVGMILGVTERGGDVIIHKEDVLVGIRNPKIPDPDKVALPGGAVDEVGFVGDGRDVVESYGSR